MSRIRKFNIYILLSSFSKALIDIFVPIILYNAGFKTEEIVFFFLLKFSFVFFLNPIICIIGKRIGYKWLDIISVIFFYLGYSYLFSINHNTGSLYVLAILLVIYEHSYWISRHYHTLRIIDKNAIGKEIGNFIIMNQMALIPASLLGSILIENLETKILVTIIAFMLLICSIITFNINIERDSKKRNYINETTNVLKTIPKRSLLFIIMEQFRVVGNIFFVLYLYLYVYKNIEYIGEFNVIVGIASIIFIYLFSKRIDKSKKSYILTASLFATIIWLLKLNVKNSFIMLIIALLQGLSDKLYEASSSRHVYSLGKNYNNMMYVMITEGIYNFSRVIICLIGLVLLNNLKIFLYLCGFMVFVGGLIGFKSNINKL